MHTIRKRLAQLGYGIRREGAQYHTYPVGQAGPHNDFATLADVARYCAQVEQIRAWQA